MASDRFRVSYLGLVARIFGALVPILAPPIHIFILYYFWKTFHMRVDRNFCTCSCWDTVFKGPYESGVASYKHFYFNATRNSMKIWIWTVMCIIALYESIRHLVTLALQFNLRYSMLLLFLSVFYSHYYSWWAYVNYWNDDFYHQWNHQLFYTVTELASTVLVVQLADKRNPVTLRKAIGIAGIGMMHVIGSSWDNFVSNVIHGKGYTHQVARDLGLMIPDLLHVVLPLLLLRGRFRKIDAELQKEFLGVILLISSGLMVCNYL
ncbi:hypothetical protein R5R35_006928 [Gryllus longicercus]|uniref:Uncharacterized protein n=1 Tax=Gryllus longicercus TaxID=2509291 RepID=A0AAN9YYC5_9ORTH